MGRIRSSVIVGVLLALVASAATIVGAPAANASTHQSFQSPLCVTGVAHYDSLNLRSGPGTNHRVIAEMPPGSCSVLQTGPAVRGWVPVAYDDHGHVTRGWAYARYLRPALVPPPPHLIPPPPPIPPPPFPVPTARFCVSAYDSLNLRSGPTTSANVITAIRSGDCSVLALGPTEGPWMLVTVDQPYRSLTGWMYGAYLRPALVPPLPVPPPPPIAVQPPFTHVCVTGVGYGDTLNLRTGPSTSHQVVAKMRAGTCVFFDHDAPPANGWLRVTLTVGGRSISGWAHGNYLAPQMMPW